MAATFDPTKVSVIIGSHIAQGFAEGTYLSATRNTDTFTRKMGAAGEVARVKSSDKSGRITFTLQQSSPTNDYLTGLYMADESSNAGRVPVMIKENGGTTIVASTETWIIKPANVEYASADMVNRVWVMESGELSLFVGSIPTN